MDQVGEGVALGYIARKLGISDRTAKFQRDRVAWLEKHHGFPPSLPSPNERLKRWDRRPVDAWFDDRVPQDLRRAVEQRELSAWDATLDRRAEEIGQAA